MAEQVGITETTAVLEAIGDVVPLILAEVRKGGSPAEIGTRVAVSLMQHPDVIEKVKNAAQNVGELKKEIEDLTIMEGFDIATVALGVVKKCLVQ